MKGHRVFQEKSAPQRKSWPYLCCVRVSVMVTSVSVCVSLCSSVCVCLSVCPSVGAKTEQELLSGD